MSSLKDRLAALSADTILAQLSAARALLAKGWCQGTAARNVHGHTVPYTDSHAVAFCVNGAMIRAGAFDLDHDKGAFKYVLAAGNFGNAPYLANWNDSSRRRHADILALMDHAVEMRRAELI